MMPNFSKRKSFRLYPLYLLSLAFIIFQLWVSGCISKNPLDIDVSKISYTPKFGRFEKDLFALDSTFPHQDYKILEEKYPDFYPLFMGRILGLEGYPDHYLSNLSHFLNNRDFRKLAHDCDSLYPNLNAFLPELSLGFRHFIYYYPQHRLPHFLTFISGFNSAIVNTDSTLGIGLDMFMGENYPVYPSLQFPRYLTRTLNSQYIAVTAMKGFAKQIFSEKKESPRLLDEMLYEGKILYFLDAMFPKLSDSIKIAYTGKQIDWCKSHEQEIWSTLLENDRIFKGDKADLDTYFSEGPFTTGLSQESAPRLGIWMGWQIIRHYMHTENAPSLQALMQEQDSEKILRLSQYRP
jgi:hypothetical protein